MQDTEGPSRRDEASSPNMERFWRQPPDPPEVRLAREARERLATKQMQWFGYWKLKEWDKQFLRSIKICADE